MDIAAPLNTVVIDIAAAAVALLAPYARDAGAAIAQHAGDAAFDAARSLYRVVKAKLSGSSQDARALDQLEQRPDDAGTQRSLEDVLRRTVAFDPAFARQLQELVDAATSNQSLVQFMTEVYGEARVGQLVNIGSAGTVRFGNVSLD